MPDTPIATVEADIWAALQLDLEPFEGDNDDMAPVDRAFVRTLIVNAEDRVARFCGFALLDLDVVPSNLAAAVSLDVANAYFNRFNPSPPDAWDELIAPHRRFGFGGAVAEESAT